MNNHYLHCTITHDNSIVKLSQVLSLSDDAEIGLLHCVLPTTIGNITHKDVITVEEVTRYARNKFVLLEHGKSMADSINAALQRAQFPATLQYSDGRFLIHIPKNYILKISTKLSDLLGMSSQLLEDTVKGKARPLEYPHPSHLSEYIGFDYRQEYRYRIPSGNYFSADHIRRTFRKFYGIDLLHPALKISPKTQWKLANDTGIYYVMICVDAVEASHLNGTLKPLLRVVPLRRTHTFHPVHYIKLRKLKDLSHLCFQVYTEDGIPLEYFGKISLMLHIRHGQL